MERKNTWLFWVGSLIWGSHFLDEERCREMFKTAIDAHVTMNEIIAEVEKHLKLNKANDEHIAKQVSKIRNLEY